METAWNFFSSPANLELITPPALKLEITGNNHGNAMYAGQVIEYTVRPLLGIPLYWMTEITHVKENEYFVDEQRFGPYTLWHHQHHFKPIQSGIEMTDLVHYKIPGWFFGDLANAIFVRRQLANIFEYRSIAVCERFGKMPAR